MPGSANFAKRARRPTLQVRMNPDEFDPEEGSSAQPTSRYARLVALPRLTVSSSEATSVPAVNVAATADANFASAVSEEALAGIRRLETMLEQIHDLRGLPVQRLKEEIEDIQVSEFLFGAFSLGRHSLTNADAESTGTYRDTAPYINERNAPRDRPSSPRSQPDTMNVPLLWFGRLHATRSAWS